MVARAAWPGLGHQGATRPPGRPRVMGRCEGPLAPSYRRAQSHPSNDLPRVTWLLSRSRASSSTQVPPRGRALLRGVCVDTCISQSCDCCPVLALFDACITRRPSASGTVSGWRRRQSGRPRQDTRTSGGPSKADLTLGATRCPSNVHRSFVPHALRSHLFRVLSISE